jgi:CIC family chloride channel protein
MNRTGLRERFLEAPKAALERIRLLTPSGVWSGTGLGLLAVVAGVAATAFHSLTMWIESHTIDRLAAGGTWVFVFGSLGSVLAGSFLASVIIARFAPSAAGGGVMPVKLAFWRDFGVLPFRDAVVKLFASALTLGSGVSMGPEGPSIQIGAATLSAAAGAAGVAKQARRAWCAAGAAAGLAAVFNAPFSAITFVLEEIIGDLQSRLLGRVVVAAVVGALLAHAFLGPQPAFQTMPLGVIGWHPWLLVPLVAVVAALGGAAFQRFAMQIRRRMNQVPKGRLTAFRPMLGAVGTWAAGIAVFAITGHAGVFGIGYRDITAAIAGGLPPTTSGLLFLAKILATAAAVGAAGCGGIFAPSLFIGAMAGACLGAAASHFLALAPGETSMLVMVGMAASLGAVIRTPFTCVLLIFEVTNQWVIVPALMLATVISLGVARLVNHHDMYEEILIQDGLDPNQVLPPRHFKRWREIPVTALASFNPIVATALDPDSLRQLLARSAHQYFPVAGPDGLVSGILSRHDAEVATDPGRGPPKLAPAAWIAPKDTVGAARKRLLDSGSDFLCVGDPSSPLVGVMTLHDLLRGESVLEDDDAS